MKNKEKIQRKKNSDINLNYEEILTEKENKINELNEKLEKIKKKYEKMKKKNKALKNLIYGRQLGKFDKIKEILDSEYWTKKLIKLEKNQFEEIYQINKKK